MNPFITHSGRALPLRRDSVGTKQILASVPVRPGAAGQGDGLLAAWRRDPELVLRQSAYAGATILISGQGVQIGCAPALAAAALAGYGFRAVISPRFGDILSHDMIQAGIVPAQLPDNVVDKLLHAVEADPPIPIVIDLDRREVSARGGPCTVFEIAEYARRRLMAGTDALADRLLADRLLADRLLADRLLAAQRSLASRDLDADVRIGLQRRLMAICDAMKAPGADAGRGQRRLEKFFSELDRQR